MAEKRERLEFVVNEARKQSVRAVEVLVEIMNDPLETGRTRIAAANAVLDRAFGKPVQQVDNTSSDGSMATPKGMAAFYAAQQEQKKVEEAAKDSVDQLLH